MERNSLYVIVSLLALALCSNLTSASDSEGIELDGNFVESYCTENFGLISFRVQNDTHDWITLNQFEVDFGDEKANKNIKVVTGKALVSWQEGISTKIESDRFIKNLILGSAAFLGGALSASSHGDTNNVGDAMLLSSLGIMAIDSIDKEIESINSSDLFPRTHLFYGDLLVAPGLSVDRWILFYSKNEGNVPFVDNIFVKYTIDKKNTAIKTKIDLREGKPKKCRWQRSIAPPEPESEYIGYE